MYTKAYSLLLNSEILVVYKASVLDGRWLCWLHTSQMWSSSHVSSFPWCWGRAEIPTTPQDPAAPSWQEQKHCVPELVCSQPKHMHGYLLTHALWTGMQKHASQQQPANKTLLKSNSIFALYRVYELLKDSFMVPKTGAKMMLWKPK